MPLTNIEKQRALRKRRAESGQKELRGIWVTDSEEKNLKPKIRKMLQIIRQSKSKNSH